MTALGRERGRSPAGPTWWWARAKGKAPLPDAIVAIDRIDGLGAIDEHDARPAPGSVGHARRDRGEPRDPRAVHRARRRLGDRRVPRDPRAGHDRRQRDERLAGDGHGRAAAVLRRVGRASLGSGERTVPLDELWTGPGSTDAVRASCSSDSSAGAGAGTGSAYVRLEYRRQMEIADRGGDRRRHHRRRFGHRCARGHHRAGPDDPPRRGGGGGAHRLRRRRRARSPRPPAPRRPARRRSPTSEGRPSTDRRWRR